MNKNCCPPTIQGMQISFMFLVFQLSFTLTLTNKITSSNSPNMFSYIKKINPGFVSNFEQGNIKSFCSMP